MKPTNQLTKLSNKQTTNVCVCVCVCVKKNEEETKI